MEKTLYALALGLGLVAATDVSAEVTFYGQPDFRGRSFTVEGPVPDFMYYGFNNRASSASIRRGTYLVCDGPDYRGRCVTLGPGDYRTLAAMGLNNRVSSVRPVARAEAAPPPPEPVAAPARAVLYPRPNLQGRGFVLEGNQVIGDLYGSGFNDRALSLRVERGYWLFCNAPEFRGACRTFGPGDYPQLPPPLASNITSGRLIHSAYPYRDQPNWR
jgi:hypothetical protein